MRETSDSKSWPLYAALGCSVLLNVVLLVRHHGASTADAVGAAAVPEAVAAVAKPAADASAPGAQPAAAPAEAEQHASLPAQPAAAGDREWTTVRGKVQQSLARTFQIEAGQDGDALSGVYTRLFVFDLDLRRDVKDGDSVAVVWRKAPDGLPEIAAASLQSTKMGHTLTAYRWQAPGDAYPSYWHLDGTEAALRLKDGPLTQYEQITSLLKDRPTHKGMDFKTPLGSEVHVPKAGTVTRTNWNWGPNGNCIEVRYDDGVLAKFLHLSENRVKEGERVSAGQVIALSGNTGHTTAPHLHYQLDRDEKVLDPIDYHGTVRRTLDAQQIAALKRDVASFEDMIGDNVVR